MNLFMGAVNYGGVPADEQVVRSTATPVVPDAPAAMAQHAPDRNQVETDPNPLLGMSGRQLASTWHQPEKYAPAWASEVDDAHLHNDIVNRQVSSSGTAAQRELAGQFGHGTAAYAEGIEPVADLIDGGSMTNNYFAADPHHANPNSEPSARGVQPANGLDRAAVSNASKAGQAASRKAAEQSAYAAFMKGVTG